MHIVQVATEFAPIAKEGGLGEVLVGLSRQLIKTGHRVEVILPKYDLIASHTLRKIKQEISSFFAPEQGQKISNAMWMAEVESCPLRLLETHHPKNYFQRGKIYGFADDPARFLYFSRAVLEYLRIKREPIDVLHLHDWHVSALAPLIKQLPLTDVIIRSIALSLHNVEYQGKCSAQDLEAIGLTKESIQRLRCSDSSPSHPYNLLKGGIEYSDAIIPVSPSYAREILTSSYGFGLDGALRENKEKIRGILNGIDLQLWDPATDASLPTQYCASDSFEAITAAKNSSRKQIANRFQLDPTKRPWVGAITRLVPQKGPELLKEALQQTPPLGGTFLLLGSSPIPEIESCFKTLQAHYKNHPQVLLHLHYDEELAHQLYSALDFLLIPSHFEPCGLTQMIAMRYGTIPIARSTGGLKDTVFDIEDPSLPASKQNGFVFQQISFSSLNQTLQRVFHLWHTNPLLFQAIMRRGMKTDFGWARPTEEYLQLFQRLLYGSQ